MSEMLDLPLRAMAEGVAAGCLSAEALTKGFLARCEEAREMRAWVYLAPEVALAEALAREGATGLLAGVPVGVKDVIDTAGMPTACGCAAYEGFSPKADAGIVALARAAGAVVLGKTVTTEFAAAAPRATRNPHNPEHTPGGSSSGSAAAVASGQVPLAFGTQTAGSIIRPASYCGTVGYKPSFGLLPRSGVSPLSDSLDTIGLYARSVADIAWATAALAARPKLLDAPPACVPQIGLYDEPGWGELSPENQLALARAREALRAAGAKLAVLPRLRDHDRLLDAQQALMDWEVPRALAHERLVLFEQLSPLTQTFISRPSPSPARYDEARAEAEAARASLPQRMAGLDGWIAPAAPGIAPQGLGSTGDPVFNRLWTVLHVPCLSVPCISYQGLPVGVQVIARDDATALALAQFLETALKEVP